jgi:hypothetical protein
MQVVYIRFFDINASFSKLAAQVVKADRTDKEVAFHVVRIRM